jgi:Mn2+/Fe2+ NRAMP family transporter
MIPNRFLIRVTVLSQVLNGVLLPPVLIYMLLLINKQRLMGKYVNSRTFNVIAWITTVVMILLTAIYAFLAPSAS